MAQITRGLRAILSHPTVYALFQWAVGANRLRRHIARLTMEGCARPRILDVGCGTADLLDFLPEVDYLGFDSNSDYIAAARRRYGHRAHFHCKQLNPDTRLEHGAFDRVLAVGLLHHLDDDSARHLFSLAREVLVPGGRLITIDACFTPDQHWLARNLIARDRGQNVRTPDGYRQLAISDFPNTILECRHDLLNFPYSHAVLRCSNTPQMQP